MIAKFAIWMAVMGVCATCAADEITLRESRLVLPKWKQNGSAINVKPPNVGRVIGGEGLSAHLRISDKEIGLEGKIDLSLVVENRLPVTRQVYFPAHNRNLESNKQMRPFKLMIYDRSLAPLGDIMLQGGGLHYDHVRYTAKAKDWRILESNEIVGVRLVVRLSKSGHEPFGKGIQLKPGVYFVQAVFSKLIDKPVPKTEPVSKSFWNLASEDDFDYFRSNAVRIVVSEHIAGSEQSPNLIVTSD